MSGNDWLFQRVTLSCGHCIIIASRPGHELKEGDAKGCYHKDHWRPIVATVTSAQRVEVVEQMEISEHGN